ncbi:MAG: hypothetical protein R3E12_18320 [Candidatus Eisenbacteria bacterium]
MPLIRILPILAACTLVGLSTQESAATIIHVPGNQPTVQIAVDVATSGDTVLVAAGAYLEDVVVLPKTLHLIGSGSGVTSISSLYYVEATGAETSGGSLEAMGVLGAIEGRFWPDVSDPGMRLRRNGDDPNWRQRTRRRSAVTESTFAASTDWDALAPFGRVSIRRCEVFGGGIDANGGYVSVVDCIVDGGSIRTYGEDCEVQRCRVRAVESGLRRTVLRGRDRQCSEWSPGGSRHQRSGARDGARQ